MQIDWITTSAQILNFLVLVFLLKRFLYRPIVAAMSRREEHIAQRMDEAAEQSTTAQQQIDDYQAKMAELEQQKRQMLENAKREADAQRTQLLDDLRADISDIRSRWLQQVEREQQAFLDQTRQLVGEQVCQVARRAFDDLAGTTLENQILEVFLQKIPSVPAEDKALLARNAAEPGLLVQTRFPLTPPWQEKITALIHDQIAATLRVRFEQAPELICGIALRGPGFKLEWSLDSYLNQIDQQLSSHLEIASSGA